MKWRVGFVFAGWLWVFIQSLAVGELRPEPMPDRKAAFRLRRLQRAIEVRGIHADRPGINAMVARIADDLRRCVKTHRLRIEKRGTKDIRVMAFEPGRGIGDQREGGRVAFRKTIAAKPLQLPKRLLSICALVAMSNHAGDALVAKLRDATRMFERVFLTCPA